MYLYMYIQASIELSVRLHCEYVSIVRLVDDLKLKEHLFRWEPAFRKQGVA